MSLVKAPLYLCFTERGSTANAQTHQRGEVRTHADERGMGSSLADGSLDDGSGGFIIVLPAHRHRRHVAAGRSHSRAWWSRCNGEYVRTFEAYDARSGEGILAVEFDHEAQVVVDVRRARRGSGALGRANLQRREETHRQAIKVRGAGKRLEGKIGRDETSYRPKERRRPSLSITALVAAAA